MRNNCGAPKRRPDETFQLKPPLTLAAGLRRKLASEKDRPGERAGNGGDAAAA
jgi:hypothetical protein